MKMFVILFVRGLKELLESHNVSFLLCILDAQFLWEKKNSYFEELIQKVAKSVKGWQNRLLIYGGMYVLIDHVLKSMSIYRMSTMNPPKGIISQIHKIMTKLLESHRRSKKGKHQIEWETMRLPKSEGGVGFRSIHDGYS